MRTDLTLSDKQKTFLAERGIDESTWHALTTSIFPGAEPQSVLMAYEYCKARKLDPLKKPCHIVPMPIRDARTGNTEWRDVVMPGIYELRTTAARTGEYAGSTEPEFGPMVEHEIGKTKIMAPEWCRMTVYRMIGGEPRPFSHIEYFEEAVATKKDGNPNSMWRKRRRGQLAKCCEAGALRKAFPEEIGGEHAAEEMMGRDEPRDVTPTAPSADQSIAALTADDQAQEPENSPEQSDPTEEPEEAEDPDEAQAEVADELDEPPY